MTIKTARGLNTPVRSWNELVEHINMLYIVSYGGFVQTIDSNDRIKLMRNRDLITRAWMMVHRAYHQIKHIK